MSEEAPEEPADGGERLARALEVLTGWELAGQPGTRTELLAAHADLRDLLEPMLPEPEARASTSDSLAERTRARLRELPTSPVDARYEIEGEVGRGGMGAVFRVTDRALNRELALKRSSALSGSPDTAGSGSLHGLARFLEEAQITGQLDHPGVVPLHELALDDQGRPYFTMKLVRGETLGSVFEKAASGLDGWTRTRALGTLLRVCETMAFAHERGVVHRDLKPANVMVGAHGEVYVMDWGLARAEGTRDDDRPAVHTDRSALRALDEASPLLTAEGALVGTPAYMSPEQARGEQTSVDRRADVYALGAMLYELLAGHPPYVPPGDRVSSARLLERVRNASPRSLSSSEPRPPAALQAICERAMAREPERRYASMDVLAGDLRSYLEGRVVSAHRTGAWAELGTWVRRNRALAAALLLAGLALLLGAVGTGVGYLREQAANERQRRSDSFQRLSFAQASLEQDQGALAADLLASIEPARRGWEWRYLDARLRRPIVATKGGPTRLADFLEDGTFVAVGQNGRVELWDLETRELRASHTAGTGPVRAAALAPTAGVLVVVDARPPDDALMAYDLSAGALLWETRLGGSVHALAVHPDEEVLVAQLAPADDGLETRLSVLGLRDGVRRAEHDAPWGTWNRRLAWSRDGQVLVACYSEATAVSYPGFEVLGRLLEPGARGGRNHVNTFGRGPLWRERDTLVVATREGVDLYALPRFEHTGSFDGGSGLGYPLGGRDGRTLYVSSGSELRVFDVPLERRMRTLQVPGEILRPQALSPSGRYLAGTTAGGALVLEVRAGAPHRIYGPTNGVVARTRWEHVDVPWGEVRLTDIATGSLVATIPTFGHSPAVDACLYDGERRLAVANEIGAFDVELVDLAARRTILGGMSRQGRARAIAGDPTGPRLATGHGGGQVVLRSGVDLSELGVLRDAGGRVSALAFSGDGRWLAAGDQRGELVVWELADPAPRRAFVEQLGSSKITALAWSEDAQRLAIGTGDGRLLQRTAQGEDPGPWPTLEAGVSHLSWHPTGDRVLASTRGRVQLVEPVSGALVFALQHGTQSPRAWFDREGERLAVVSRDADLVVHEATRPGPALARARGRIQLAREAVLRAFGRSRTRAEAEEQLDALELEGEAAELARGMLPLLAPAGGTLWNEAVYVGGRSNADRDSLERALLLASELLARYPERPRYRALRAELLEELERPEAVVELLAPSEPGGLEGTWHEDVVSLCACQLALIRSLARLDRSAEARAALARFERWSASVPARWRAGFDEHLDEARALLGR